MDEINLHADRTLVPTGDKRLAEVYVDGRGVRRCKGTAHLKGGQAYPRQLLNCLSFDSTPCSETNPKLYHKAYVLPYMLNPRLGRVVARARTKFQKLNRRRARQFLASAATGNGLANYDPDVNHMWIKLADLKPVMAFLTS